MKLHTLRIKIMIMPLILAHETKLKNAQKGPATLVESIEKREREESLFVEIRHSNNAYARQVICR